MSTPIKSNRQVLAAAAVALAVVAAACGPGVDKATKMLVTEPPEQVTAGQPLNLTATIQTNQNETVEAYEGEVTVTILTGPALDALIGQTTVRAVKGVATFTDLALTVAGEGYQLTFRAETVSGGRAIGSVNRGPVTVVPAAAAAIAVVEQPGRAAVNGTIFPFPQVAVTDAYGNVVDNESTTVTVALGNNPSGATLSGTLTQETTNAVATFDDLAINELGTGYTLRFSTSASNVESAAFDVAEPKLVYTDPPAGGAIRVVRNSASTDQVAVLDVVAGEAFTGYSVGFTIPMAANTIRAASPLITHVGGLDPGTAPAAVGAAFPTTGKLAGSFTAGISQKASGGGAVPTDTAVPAGTVLFRVRLQLVDTPIFRAAFDGEEMGRRFEAAVRNRAGEDVVRGLDFNFGRLAVE